jgi:hypothetical protein
LTGAFFIQPIRIASAAAVTALVFIGVFMWLRSHPDRSEIVAQPPSVPAPAKPPAVIALNDGGGLVMLDSGGFVKGLNSVSPGDRGRVIAALTTGKVEPPEALDEVRASASALMGSSPSQGFALSGPIGNIVATTRPTFRWRPLAGATAYQVTITDPVAGYNEVATSPTLGATSWTVNRPLQRGRTYSWQVTAQTPNGEVKAPSPAGPEARFRVLEREKAAKLEAARKTYAGHHLVLGVLYTEAGLLKEAEAEFEALVRANPESDLAATLLYSVRSGQR